MAGKFQSLVKAILDDDRARVNALLKQDPALATAGASKARLEMQIPHWIYAGDTALHVASAAYRLEVAKVLLDAGADVSAAMNHRRSRPLHYAADGSSESPNWNAKRQVAMIELLLESGADIHARDKNGATPLHRAVRTRCAEAVTFLLDAGADPTLQNKPGSTPFHLAVQNTGRGGSGSETAREAQHQIIQTFLDHGTSPTLEDAKGKSIRDWAKSDWIQQMLATDGQLRRNTAATNNNPS